MGKISKALSRFAVSSQAFLVKWSDEAFVIDDNWNKENNRLLRYFIYNHLYSNTLFTDYNRLQSTLKNKYGLYRFTKGVFNPVQRLVEGYVSFIYGGEIDKTNLSRGAIPIVSENDTELEAIKQLFNTMDIKLSASNYARKAAIFADSFLKVVDRPDKRKVYFEVLDPRKVKEVQVDSEGNITYIRIAYNRYDEEGEKYLYTEEIDEKEFKTFKDEEPFTYEDNPVQSSSWSNVYGYVPVVHGKFFDFGEVFAYNAFHSQLEKIFGVSDALSLIVDNMRKASEQIYHAKGLVKGQIKTNSDEPTSDSIRIIYADGELNPLIDTIAYSEFMTVITQMIDEIVMDTPILSLHQLRSQSQISAVAVRAAYSDAINLIQEVQGNLDSSLEKIIAMCLDIMQIRGIVSGLGTNYYLDDLHTFYIKNREVIHDELDNLQVVQILQSLDYDNPATTYILEQLSVPSDEIETIQSNAELRRQDRIQQAAIIARINSQNAGLAEIRNRTNGSQNNEDLINNDTVDTAGN